MVEVLLLKTSIEWGYGCDQPETQASVCLLGYADTVSYEMELVYLSPQNTGQSKGNKINSTLIKQNKAVHNFPVV